MTGAWSRDVTRHESPGIGQHRESSDGHQVGRDEKGVDVGVLGQELRHRERTAGSGEVSVLDGVRRQSGLAERGRPASQPVEARGHVLGSGDGADPAKNGPLRTRSSGSGTTSATELVRRVTSVRAARLGM